MAAATNAADAARNPKSRRNALSRSKTRVASSATAGNAAVAIAVTGSFAISGMSGGSARAGAVEDVARREGCATYDEVGQGFEPDGKRKAGDGAGGPGRPAQAIRPHGRGDGEHRKRDLHIVMIDAPRPELVKCRQPG